METERNKRKNKNKKCRNSSTQEKKRISTNQKRTKYIFGIFEWLLKTFERSFVYKTESDSNRPPTALSKRFRTTCDIKTNIAYNVSAFRYTRRDIAVVIVLQRGESHDLF